MGNTKSSGKPMPKLMPMPEPSQNFDNVRPQKPQKSQQPSQSKNAQSIDYYAKLDAISNIHGPKTYKQPLNQVIIQQDYPSEYYAPRLPFYQQDINSNQYFGLDFGNPFYINNIPKRKTQSKVTIDSLKTLFFKIGHSPVYSETIYCYAGFANPGTSWADIENPSYRVERKMAIPDNVLRLMNNPLIRKELMQAGWFVMIGHKWGFLLNLESITEAYQGYLPNRWRTLLAQPFFADMLERFGSYIEEMYEESQQKGVLPREIPSTDFDLFLPDWYVTFNDDLFWRQKQEVAWMFRLENSPVIKLKKKMKALPFFDTGYYVDLSDKTGFIASETKNTFVDIIMPGGILASQIGSGKTVTAVGLMTIGSQFKYPSGGKKPNMNDVNFGFEMNELNYWLEGVYEPSLIIVTKNILGQWAEEINRFAPHLQVAYIENTEGLQNVQVIKVGSQYRFKKYDIILTHRKIIEDGDLIQKYCPDFFKVTFRRVIMDEFHELTTMMMEEFGNKNSSKQSKKEAQAKKVLVEEKIDMFSFCVTLKKIDRRFTWGITGTPDCLDYFNETAPLFRLLNLNESQQNKINTFSKMKDEFVSTCMRKNPRSIDLPPLTKVVEKVFFSELQNILYKGKLNYALNKKAAEEICSHLLPQWRELEDSKDPLQTLIEVIQKKHQHEITELEAKIQMQKVTGVDIKRLEILRSESNFFSDVIKLVSEEFFECPICLISHSNDKIVISECMHNICADCYENLKKTLAQPQCPVCRENILNNGLLIHPRFREKKENKLTAILKAIQETPADDKVIIFTQFHNLVEHLSEIFDKVGIQYIVLKGEPSDINISLAKFRIMPELKVLLMSIEQSASGINVLAANHVFFAHPIFGMEFGKAALTYNQCIGRAYRTGQTKPVEVKLFVTVDSIEEDLIPSFNKYKDTLI